jgi:hypothetical protein
MLAGFEYVLIALAAVAAGAVNALAGGGTLITFPVLMAVGVPAVAANLTNTVALCPGYLGGTLAQRRDLAGQRGRLLRLVPAGIVGGVAGGALLLLSGEKLFRALVPFLILLASALLALHDPLRARLARGASAKAGGDRAERWAAIPAGLAAVYGGYFGAGLGVILLAVLALVLEDTLTRLNALKQSISLAANVAAAVFFLFTGRVVWEAAIVMAAGALAGGALGGRLAGRVRPEVLRGIVVAIGVVVALIYWTR